MDYRYSDAYRAGTGVADATGAFSFDAFMNTRVRDTFDLEASFALAYYNHALEFVKPDWMGTFSTVVSDAMSTATDIALGIGFWTYSIHFASSAVSIGNAVGESINWASFSDEIQSAQADLEQIARYGQRLSERNQDYGQLLESALP
ncbi:MAG: hypothetical protein C1943_08235 [Halochromatium sp.]|nr:hypothetical protein [Halochromatium sp.]